MLLWGTNLGRFKFIRRARSHVDDLVHVFDQLLDSFLRSPQRHVLFIKLLGRLNQEDPRDLITMNPFGG